MKIIQLITKKQRRGAEIFAAQLADNLQKKGHELLIIYLYEGEGNLPFSGKMIGLNANPQKRWFDPKAWKRLDSIIRNFQPDLIQANASETLKFAVFSRKLSGWKTPLVYRNANLISGFLNVKAKLFFNRWLMAEVNAVVSVSESTLKDFRTIFKVKQQIAIPIGIDLEAIASQVAQLASSNISEDYLIFIGGLVREKDPLGLLEYFEKLQIAIPNLRLVYVGSGPLGEALKNKLQEKGLENNVLVIANQENVFPLLSNAKALVMPSKIEGLPAVILEAMFLQIPVIAYDVGGISEVLQTGKTGWLVPAGDQKGFQDAILQCLAMPDSELRKITNSAKKQVQDHYEISKIANEFEAFYLRLLNSSTS